MAALDLLILMVVEVAALMRRVAMLLQAPRQAVLGVTVLFPLLQVHP
jgi:hypothetical protein